MLTFADHPAITLAFSIDLENWLDKNNIEYDHDHAHTSNSAYYTILDYSEDDPDPDTLKVRISDHVARYGCDVCLDYSPFVEGVYDDGYYIESEMDEGIFVELLDNVKEEIEDWLEE